MTSETKRLQTFQLHSHPEAGSPYWIEFFRNSPIPVREAAANPLLLPPMDPEVLRRHPVEHFIPRQVLSGNRFLVTGETSGFSGKPIMTVFSQAEFTEGFVTPFLIRAAEVGFPVRSKWLWAGPSGPHIIGKAVREILRAVNGMDPFSIDFDPRWYKRLPENSLSRQRYFDHLEEQIFTLLNTQQVEVIFSTPPVIRMLCEKLPAEYRARIKGIHYGGIAVDFAEYRHFNACFPNAVHLNGYGNSLFGVFIEESFDSGGIEYRTSSARVDVDLIKSEGGKLERIAVGETGQVMLSRYDETFLIVNLLERDFALKTERGIKNPHPLEQYQNIKVLY